jgi:hypothetical protein
VDAQTDADRSRTYKEFAADCARHVEKIAKTYIREEEKTLDIAMMYVPAENVYYHILLPPTGSDGESIMEAEEYDALIEDPSDFSFRKLHQRLIEDFKQNHPITKNTGVTTRMNKKGSIFR